MEITNEILQTIYKRAIQYSINRFGKEPDKIELNDEYLEAVWENYKCGDYDIEKQFISAENLSENLDEVYKKRIQELEEKRIQEEIRRKKEEEERKKREKECRFQDYLKLKKEFE